MKAVILAAGKGERLGSLTQKLPKPMLPYQGKPILEHNINLCRQHGIREILINLHHLPEAIEGYFQDGSRWGVSIRYKREEKILGTSGAVKNFEKELGKDPFFVIYGDNYSDVDLSQVLKIHHEKKAAMSLVLFELQDVSISGIAELGGNDRIIRFIEKPNGPAISHWVNAGIYVMEKVLVEEIPSGFSDFGKDAIPLFIQKEYPLFGVRVAKPVVAFDTPELLKKSQSGSGKQTPR